jgi:glyoxylase-like metal-dependent hydrolase (beta-lactamase superfamily II)
VPVDAGMSSEGADVSAGSKELGAGPSDIRAILLTHWHNDHVAGARKMHVLSGAPVFYHDSDTRILYRRSWRARTTSIARSEPSLRAMRLP